MRAEADRVRELALVVDPVDVERAHADPVRADAEPDAPARQLVARVKKLSSAAASAGDVAHLAADDDAGLERNARELHELRASRRC